ncbi:MAG: hypothetical protein IT361_15270 [Gemmatimonadaceae bacterium]|nr:hypothetical protein [Gemmatimonadaceae bacterium]
MHRFVPLLLLLPLAGPRHDIHLTHTRLVVEGRKITGRIRLFHDDTEAALQRSTGRRDLRITAADPQRAAFERYLDSTVALTAGGRRLPARVVAAGADPGDGIAPMWWYDVEYLAPARVTRLGLRHAVMFDQFDNQRNIVSVLVRPGDRRFSLYFAVGDRREHVLTF